MKIFLGVDAGASGVRALAADETLSHVGRGEAGMANHQFVGYEAAVAEMGTAVETALMQIAARAEDVAASVFGIAGADRPVDFERLRSGLTARLPGLPMRIVNDAWLPLRAGTPDGVGVVSLGGSGGNAAGRNRYGKEAILRGQTYELGSRGGAFDVLRESLHWAYRAHDGVGPPTELVTAIPAAVGFRDLESLAELVGSSSAGGHPGPEAVLAAQLVVPVVFSLAEQGDRVSQDILLQVGQAMGDQVAGIIRRLGMEKERVRVVLAGGMFKNPYRLLKERLVLEVRRTAPQAEVDTLSVPPVAGGLLMAMEDAGLRPAENLLVRLAGE